MADVVIPYHPRATQQDIHRGLESRRWSIVVAHRRLGKTVCVLNHMIKQAMLCNKQAPFFAYIAPFYTQAKQIAWKYLLHYTAPIPGRKVNNSELYVELPNGATIKIFGADNPDSLRGLYFDGVILDEFADMKPEAWEAVIRPALSDRQGWAVFIGTPRGYDKFHEIYSNALLDSDHWFAGLYEASTTNVIIPSELEDLRRTMTESKYRQEYLCDFNVSSDDILIPIQLIQGAVGRHVSYAGSPVIMGVDVGMSLGGDPSAIIVREGAHIIHLEEFRKDDTIEIAGRVKTRCEEFRPDAIFIDGIGWGAGVAHHLGGWGYPVVSVNVGETAAENDKYSRRRDELWWKGREFFSNKTCGIKPELELVHKFVAELSTPTYGYLPNGRIKVESKQDLKKREKPSPNIADAFILTMGFQMPVENDGHRYSYSAITASRGEARRIII